MNNLLRKFGNYLKSMKFGLLLLTLILILCIAGTLIPQGKTAEEYAALFGGAGSLIPVLHLDDLYSAPYFIALFALLCLNLILCSLIRAGRLRTAAKNLQSRAAAAEADLPADREWLREQHFRRLENGVYVKHLPGLYGSFLTHAGLLLLLAAGACTLLMQTQTNLWAHIGEKITLADGTCFTVTDFRTENTEGDTDYISTLAVTLTDGTQLDATVSVNHPVKAGACTLYQQSYNYAPLLSVYTEEAPDPQTFIPEDTAFLTLDGENGIWFTGLFGDHETDENGKISPVFRGDGAMPNPVYTAATVENGSTEEGVVMPGTTLTAGGVYVAFEAPRAYPGLRVRTVPAWVIPLLYFSFIVLLAGLCLCFLLTPAAVYLSGERMALVSTRDLTEWKTELHLRERNKKQC